VPLRAVLFSSWSFVDNGNDFVFVVIVRECAWNIGWPAVPPRKVSGCCVDGLLPLSASPSTIFSRLLLGGWLFCYILSVLQIFGRLFKVSCWFFPGHLFIIRRFLVLLLRGLLFVRV
jgi:hypothetical protein